MVIDLCFQAEPLDGLLPGALVSVANLGCVVGVQQWGLVFCVGFHGDDGAAIDGGED